MILLFDIGNTNTHLGLAGPRQIRKHLNFPTASWFEGAAEPLLQRFAGQTGIEGAALCSVVPRVTPRVREAVKRLWRAPVLELGPNTISGVGINYPLPETIGPDRLANAVAVRHHFGAPSVVVDFGTAVTFDVIEPPRLPLIPTAPNRLLLYSGVLMASMVAGLAAAFFLNLHNGVFYSARKLRAVTGLPIFGSVSVAHLVPMGRRDLLFAGIASGLLVAFLALLLAGRAGFTAV